MRSIKSDFNCRSEISNIKLVIITLGIPITLVPVLAMIKFFPTAYNWIADITNGLITQTLITYLIMYFVFIYLLLLRTTNLNLSEIGISKSKIKSGVVVTLLFFLITQFYSVTYSYYSFGKLEINQTWNNIFGVIGQYLQYFIGVAFFEEVVFRSILIPQTYKRLNRICNENLRILLALGVSQFFFSIVHIPIRIVNGIDLGTLFISLTALFAIGIVFAFIYILTDNIFICIGIHGLWDLAMNNTISIFSAKYIVIVLGVCILLFMYFIATKNKAKTIESIAN